MLVGKSAVKFIVELDEVLTKRTLEYAEASDGLPYTHYVPWMCLLKKLGRTATPLDIMTRRYEPGELLIKPSLLKEISDFMLGPGKLIYPSLVENDDLTVFEDIEIERPQASEVFTKARYLLIQANPLFEKIFYKLCKVVVPLFSTKGINTGNSAHLARGAIFHTIQTGQWASHELAVDLAHEIGHQAFMIFQSADRIINSQLYTPTYSGIRKTMRPAIQSLHAAVALGYIILAAEGMAKMPDCDDELSKKLMLDVAECENALRETLSDLNKKVEFTKFGERIVEGLSGLIDDKQ